MFTWNKKSKECLSNRFSKNNLIQVSYKCRSSEIQLIFKLGDSLISLRNTKVKSSDKRAESFLRQNYAEFK